MSGLVWLSGCQPKGTVFEEQDAADSGIDFFNAVAENDTLNVLEYMNVYTGGGVAAADFNNDGLVDLFFSGNVSSSELYLNLGGLKFRKTTAVSGLTTTRWCTGVSAVDIDADGLMDLYVNVAGSAKLGSTRNLFFINKGIDKDGVPHFAEQAEALGVASEKLTMNASFLDYDRDGDLDIFLITNPADSMLYGVNTIQFKSGQSTTTDHDILLRNDGQKAADGTFKPHFTDVSTTANITEPGYGLGAAVSDVNLDGWPDIYVSNDFLSNDLLYVNQKDGTFRNEIRDILDHTSFASMGNDIADFNNDGLPDIMVLDMLPEDNLRKKMLIPAAKYDRFQMAMEQGYVRQYTRNTLQMHRGVHNGQPVFSEVAFLAGVSATDWSWAPLWADFDLDGDKDLFVSNGFYRDLGNMDYITYQMKSQSPMGTQAGRRNKKLNDILDLETVPLLDYLFENQGAASFTNQAAAWGIRDAGFSHGAAYADLDNDGDLELIVNRLNGRAQLYKNVSREQGKNFIGLKLAYQKPNPAGIGAKVTVYADSLVQYQEFMPTRGYQSCMNAPLVFGLGTRPKIDSVRVVWPDGRRQVEELAANGYHTLTYRPNREAISPSTPPPLITELPMNEQFIQPENQYVDFKSQTLLPYQLSRQGPALAVGDVDGDGRDDFYLGGAAGFSGEIGLQTAPGKFRKIALNQDQASEDTDALLLDADGDGDLDLYVVSGGSEFPPGDAAYQDRLYLNDGRGRFQKSGALPPETRSGSCVRAADYDRDGDLDLFVGTRFKPADYPRSEGSFLLKNQLKETGKLSFLPDQNFGSQLVGMVTDAVWSDLDGDGWPDLGVVGDFMPVTIFNNKRGILAFAKNALPATSGWAQSVVSVDVNQDGRMDLVVGNFGLNSRYRATEKEPLQIHLADYDKNGTDDPILSYYVQGQPYIAHARDELTTQIPAMKSRFPHYNEYAKATFGESFMKEELAGAEVFTANEMASFWLENTGGGQFAKHLLPREAQLSPITSLLVEDLDGDRFPDLIAVGNANTIEVGTGDMDAGKGLVLLNKKGKFEPLDNQKSGFYTSGFPRKIQKINLGNPGSSFLLSSNEGALRLFEMGGRR